MTIQHFPWTGTFVCLLTTLLASACTTAPENASMSRYEAIQQDCRREGMKQGVSDAELTIPYSPTMSYPEDWSDLSRRR